MTIIFSISYMYKILKRNFKSILISHKNLGKIEEKLFDLDTVNAALT